LTWSATGFLVGLISCAYGKRLLARPKPKGTVVNGNDTAGESGRPGGPGEPARGRSGGAGGPGGEGGRGGEPHGVGGVGGVGGTGGSGNGHNGHGNGVVMRHSSGGLPRWLGVILVVLALGSVGEGWLLTRQQAEVTRDNALRTCQAGNDTRAAQVSVWNYVLDLSAASAPQTPQQKARAEQFRTYVAKTFAARDCEKATK
jgi:hypothetical protein